MNINKFERLQPDRKVSYLKKDAVLIQSVIRGEFLISLFWTRDLIFEVFYLRNDSSIFEIKSYNRKQYVA